jgi:hypothetical protein
MVAKESGLRSYLVELQERQKRSQLHWLNQEGEYRRY